MMNNLLLITNNYPFGKCSETFIETEINYLSKKFDNIYILATKPDSEKLRFTPGNVHINKFSNKNLFFRSWAVFFRNPCQVLKLIYFENRELKSGKKEFLIKFRMMINHAFKAFLLKDYIIREYIEKNRIDIIYSYWFNSAALAACLVKKEKKGITVISRLHGWDLYTEHEKSNYFPFQRLKRDLIDRAYFISEHGRAYFEKKYGSSEKYRIAKLGVERVQNEISFERSQKKYTIASCSYFDKIKRIDLIIKGLALIEEVMIEWVHIGGGELFEEMNALANTLLGNKSNISYRCTGTMPNPEVYDFYSRNNVDLFINVSLTEGLPVSIMEAMSFGIPAIATDTGGSSEIVNSQCGILLDLDCSPNDISAAILNILSRDDENYRILRQNAYENWKENYNAKLNYTAFASEIATL
jgi:glycosyltransferase involved in cell wall biosynthesis